MPKPDTFQVSLKEIGVMDKVDRLEKIEYITLSRQELINFSIQVGLDMMLQLAPELFCPYEYEKDPKIKKRFKKHLPVTNDKSSIRNQDTPAER